MKRVVLAGTVSGALYGACLAVPDWGREFTRFLPLYGGLVLAYLLGLTAVGRETRWSLLGTAAARVSDTTVPGSSWGSSGRGR